MSYSRSAATVAGGWDNCIHAARADKQFLGMPGARIPRNA